jgi:hypothetical protein
VGWRLGLLPADLLLELELQLLLEDQRSCPLMSSGLDCLSDGSIGVLDMAILVLCQLACRQEEQQEVSSFSGQRGR